MPRPFQGEIKIDVSRAYTGSRLEVSGGEITKVVLDIADDAYVDVEARLRGRHGPGLARRWPARSCSRPGTTPPLAKPCSTSSMR